MKINKYFTFIVIRTLLYKNEMSHFLLNTIFTTDSSKKKKKNSLKYYLC